MKRTGISRLTPMPPPSPWIARSESRLSRSSSSRARQAPVRAGAPRDTGPSRKVRDLVLARDSYQCAGCGKPVGGAYTWWSLQHRKARGVGGDNSPCNLVALCGSATSPGCHRRCEDRDREMHERGLWLRSDEDPALVPVMIASEYGSGITAWPTEDGRWVFEAPAGAA